MSTTSAPRDRLRFDRADSIATTILLWFLVGGSLAYALFISVDWFKRGQLTLTGVPLDVPAQAAPAGRVVGPVEAAVLVDNVSGSSFALVLASVLVAGAATVWGAVLLSRFLRDLGAGEPFTAANVTRLRIVGLLLLVVPILAEMLYAFGRAEALGDGGAEPADSFGMSFTLAWVVAGLLVAAIAQAFAAGRRLRDDVDGLV